MEIAGPRLDPVSRRDAPDRSREMEIAKRLEVTFMAEMLKSVGMNSSAEGFDGGIGEEQFQSFLREKQAELIVEKGGLGLAEHFLRSITEKKV